MTGVGTAKKLSHYKFIVLMQDMQTMLQTPVTINDLPPTAEQMFNKEFIEALEKWINE